MQVANSLRIFLLLASIAALSSSPIYSQYTGVMGRRFSVNLRGYYFPSFSIDLFEDLSESSSYSSNKQDPFSLRPKTRLHFGVEYALSPSNTIGLSYCYSNIISKHKVSFMPSSFFINEPYNTIAYANVVTTGFVFNYRKDLLSRYGNAHSQGPYTEFLLGYLNSKYKFDIRSPYTNAAIPVHSESVIWFGMGLGTSTVVANRVIIGGGVQYLAWGSRLRFGSGEIVEPSSEVTFYRRSNAANRFVEGNIMMIYARLGVLIF